MHAYGLVDLDAAGPMDLRGIGGAEVESGALGGLRVLFSRLDPVRYGARAWAEGGQDPEWLRDVARSHHGVLQAWLEQADVLPLRLPSLHAGVRPLLRAMRARLPELAEALSRIRDRWEWGLKILLASASVPSVKAGRGRTKTGREYLLARAEEAASRDSARRTREEMVRRIYESLSALAEHAQVGPPQDRALTGRTEPMLLNAAYLMPRAERQRMVELVSRWAMKAEPLGLRVELTGPWPPYHFVTVSAEPRGGNRGLAH